MISLSARPLNIMVDIEALGQVPGSVVTCAAFVPFDFDTGEAAQPEQSLVMQFDIDAQVRAGLKVGHSTLWWWFAQSDGARKAAIVAPSARKRVTGSLFNELELWAKHTLGLRGDTREECRLWAKGADYDFGLLRALFDTLQMPWPFHYAAARCMRTYGDGIVFSEADKAVWKAKYTEHDAYQDCRLQIEQLMAMKERRRG